MILKQNKWKYLKVGEINIRRVFTTKLTSNKNNFDTHTQKKTIITTLQLVQMVAKSNR